MRFSLFWDVTQRRTVVTDVSVQPVSDPSSRIKSFKMGPIACPETSVTNSQSVLPTLKISFSLLLNKTYDSLNSPASIISSLLRKF
jgi:hypothetical protein